MMQEEVLTLIGITEDVYLAFVHAGFEPPRRVGNKGGGNFRLWEESDIQRLREFVDERKIKTVGGVADAQRDGLTSKAVCAQMCISPSTLGAWIRKREFVPPQMVRVRRKHGNSGVRFWSPSDIQRLKHFMAERYRQKKFLVPGREFRPGKADPSSWGGPRTAE